MALNASLDLVLSIDSRGMIEYWDADTYLTISSTDPRVSFKYKTDTDLYVIAREKTVPCCLVISPTGDRFVVTTRDKQIRVFDFASGKLKLQVDESARSYMVRLIQIIFSYLTQIIYYYYTGLDGWRKFPHYFAIR
jgi:peptidylprolyl isomerase domain and WD repeat-containing protein 1